MINTGRSRIAPKRRVETGCFLFLLSLKLPLSKVWNTVPKVIYLSPAAAVVDVRYVQFATLQRISPQTARNTGRFRARERERVSATSLILTFVNLPSDDEVSNRLRHSFTGDRDSFCGSAWSALHRTRKKKRRKKQHSNSTLQSAFSISHHNNLSHSPDRLGPWGVCQCRVPALCTVYASGRERNWIGFDFCMACA